MRPTFRSEKAAGDPMAALLFFTSAEMATVEAVTARLIPSDDGSPGAREARAAVYIDRAVAGYFSALQVLYREGLQLIDGVSRRRHGECFVALGSEQQDDVLRAIERPTAPDGSPRSAQFFEVVLEHTIEGVFGDPAYGGNHDLVGWRMIGFPGAQIGYTAEQMAAGGAITDIPLRTLADIQSDAETSRGRG